MLRRVYLGLFCWIYEFNEKAPSKWLSEWKSYLVLSILELSILFSLLIYYSEIFDPIENIKQFLLPIIVFFTFKNYIIFERNEAWKNYIHDFNKLSYKQKNKYLKISCLIILLVILNFSFAFYLMSNNS